MKKEISIMIIFFLLLVFCGCSYKESAVNSLIENQSNSAVIANDTFQSSLKDLPPPAKTRFFKTGGIVVFNEDNERIKQANGLIRIYDETGAVWNTINYYADSSTDLSAPGGPFRPFSFRAGDFQLKMRCIGKSDNWYEVIVQEEVSPKVKKYVRADDPLFEFQTWETYILNISDVDFEHSLNPILQSPGGKVKTVDLPKDISIVALEVNGDWVKIRWDIDQNRNFEAKKNNVSTSNDSGWIRWRNGEKILIYEFYP